MIRIYKSVSANFIDVFGARGGGHFATLNRKPRYVSEYSHRKTFTRARATIMALAINKVLAFRFATAIVESSAAQTTKEKDMESINDLKARIVRITSSTFPVTDHNKLIINAACKALYERTGEILLNGSFVKVA